MEEREKLRSNQRRSSSAENKIFFVGKKYVGYFSSGLVKGKFGMKLGLKLRRANLGLSFRKSMIISWDFVANKYL